eukprot:Skav227077  [mRNA]  locus=scaffold4434:38804:41805:+ [translate_table: standard]
MLSTAQDLALAWKPKGWTDVELRRKDSKDFLAWAKGAIHFSATVPLPIPMFTLGRASCGVSLLAGSSKARDMAKQFQAEGLLAWNSQVTVSAISMPGLSASVGTERLEHLAEVMEVDDILRIFKSNKYPFATGMGIDINPTATRLAEQNAQLNGLAERGWAAVNEPCCSMQVKDLKDWTLPATYDLVIANPPYSASKAERLESYQQDMEDAARFAGGFHGSFGWCPMCFLHHCLCL